MMLLRRPVETDRKEERLRQLETLGAAKRDGTTGNSKKR